MATVERGADRNQDRPGARAAVGPRADARTGTARTRADAAADARVDAARTRADTAAGFAPVAGELRAAARGSGVLVRSAVPADAGGIAVVQVDGWRAAYAHILPPAELAELSLVRAEQLWHGVIGGARESGKQVLVAEGDGGEVLGFAALGPERAPVPSPSPTPADPEPEPGSGLTAAEHSLPAGELYAFYVHPRHWRHGLGGALMDAALRR